MNSIILSKELHSQDKIYVLPSDGYVLESGLIQHAFLIVDFSRKYEEADLNKIPVNIAYAFTLQDKYSLYKYNIVVAEVSQVL